MELEFVGKRFTDRKLKRFSDLHRVEQLSLIETSVTDAGFEELRRAHSLKEIVILSDRLTDAALEVLSGLPALKSLQIHHGPKIGDRGLAHLTKCVKMRELYLIDTDISDDGLRYIGELPELWSLWLKGTRVTDAGCEELTGLYRLGLLGLDATKVTGRGLALIPDNKGLSIYLDETPASDEGVVALAANLSNLKDISLVGTDVGDAAARALSKLEHLNSVRLSETNVTDEGFLAFANHPALEEIQVEGCAVTAEAASFLKKASPRQLEIYP